TGVTKTYDGTTNLPVGVTGYGTLTGIVGSDEVTVTGAPVFDSKNAGSRSILQGSLALAGAAAGNYTLSWTNGSGTITPRTLNLVWSAQDKMFDGTTAAVVAANDDRIAGDVLMVAGLGAFSNPMPGVGKLVSITGVALSGADAGNYQLSSTTGTATATIIALPVPPTPPSGGTGSGGGGSPAPGGSGSSGLPGNNPFNPTDPMDGGTADGSGQPDEDETSPAESPSLPAPLPPAGLGNQDVTKNAFDQTFALGVAGGVILQIPVAGNEMVNVRLEGFSAMARNESGALVMVLTEPWSKVAGGTSEGFSLMLPLIVREGGQTRTQEVTVVVEGNRMSISVQATAEITPKLAAVREKTVVIVPGQGEASGAEFELELTESIELVVRPRGQVAEAMLREQRDAVVALVLVEAVKRFGLTPERIAAILVDLP
ncbi:MAG: YDG domain-containing protein, partial [Methylophilaceae bacterium]|nr:YDG domain-containing protein [Methylophilaceae bacterium]